MGDYKRWWHRPTVVKLLITIIANESHYIWCNCYECQPLSTYSLCQITENKERSNLGLQKERVKYWSSPQAGGYVGMRAGRQLVSMATWLNDRFCTHKRKCIHCKIHLLRSTSDGSGQQGKQYACRGDEFFSELLSTLCSFLSGHWVSIADTLVWWPVDTWKHTGLD